MVDVVRTAASLTSARGRLGSSEVGPYDLDVAPGEVVALTGPNGAGKTTALQLLLGLRRLTTGTATVLGAPVTTDRPPMGAGVSLLDDGSRPWLTGHQELADVALVRPGAPDRDAVLEVVGLGGAAHRRGVGAGRRRAHRPRAARDDPLAALLDRRGGACDTSVASVNARGRMSQSALDVLHFRYGTDKVSTDR